MGSFKKERKRPSHKIFRHLAAPCNYLLPGNFQLPWRRRQNNQLKRTWLVSTGHQNVDRFKAKHNIIIVVLHC